ncbi:hypothetical protein ACLBOM_10650 [Escherichia coli]
MKPTAGCPTRVDCWRWVELVVELAMDFCRAGKAVTLNRQRRQYSGVINATGSKAAACSIG